MSVTFSSTSNVACQVVRCRSCKRLSSRGNFALPAFGNRAIEVCGHCRNDLKEAIDGEDKG